jgi:hypothetical protein
MTADAFIFDNAVATDPYYIWKGLDPRTRLSRQIVQSGLGYWLASQLKWIWDDQTQSRTPWYLNRVMGLSAWCWYEAGLRLSSFSHQDSFTAAEFCEFHFSEEAKEHGEAEIKDPFWDTLFAHKKAQGEVKFFRHLHMLVNQAPFEFRQEMRLYCMLWDRAWIPLEHWSGEAAATYLEVKLGQINRHRLSPSSELLRQWQHRLGLAPFRPAVITKYTPKGQIPAGGFSLDAFELAEIPAPSMPTPENPS